DYYCMIEYGRVWVF
nr:immunoglobulin light chain junction region [Macaca mulatta]